MMTGSFVVVFQTVKAKHKRKHWIKIWFKSSICQKKSFDLNHDLNHWFKSAWFKSANPGSYCDIVRKWFARTRPRSCFSAVSPDTIVCHWFIAFLPLWPSWPRPVTVPPPVSHYPSPSHTLADPPRTLQSVSWLATATAARCVGVAAAAAKCEWITLLPSKTGRGTTPFDV